MHTVRPRGLFLKKRQNNTMQDIVTAASLDIPTNDRPGTPKNGSKHYRLEQKEQLHRDKKGTNILLKTEQNLQVDTIVLKLGTK